MTQPAFYSGLEPHQALAKYQFDKQVEALSREEAIEMLKALNALMVNQGNLYKQLLNGEFTRQLSIPPSTGRD